MACRGSAIRRATVIDFAVLRVAVRERRKVRIDYTDVAGKPTARTIWPIGTGYLEFSRVVVAWCELRTDFRHFRADRIVAMDVLPARYPATRAKLLAEWRASMAAIVQHLHGFGAPD